MTGNLETILKTYLRTNGVSLFWTGRAIYHIRESGILASNFGFCIDIAKPTLKVERGSVRFLSFDATLRLPDSGRNVRTRVSYSGPTLAENWKIRRGTWKEC